MKNKTIAAVCALARLFVRVTGNSLNTYFQLRRCHFRRVPHNKDRVRPRPAADEGIVTQAWHGTQVTRNCGKLGGVVRVAAEAVLSVLEPHVLIPFAGTGGEGRRGQGPGARRHGGGSQYHVLRGMTAVTCLGLRIPTTSGRSTVTARFANQNGVDFSHFYHTCKCSHLYLEDEG